jgi:hypothetical protein
MATPKLEYIEELVSNSFSDDLKQTLNFRLNENNVVIIKIEYETLFTMPSVWGESMHRRIVETLYSFGMRVNEDYIVETDISWKNTLQQ